MSDAGWAGLLTAIHDRLFACDRETRFTLAGADRRLWLTVRADSVTVEIPAYDPARLATLGWRTPKDGRDLWFYDVPRSVEHVDWLCRFAVHGASLLISPDPATLTFHEAAPDDAEEIRPALTIVPAPAPAAPEAVAPAPAAWGASASGPAAPGISAPEPFAPDTSAAEPFAQGTSASEPVAAAASVSESAASENAPLENAASEATAPAPANAAAAAAAPEIPARRPSIPAQRQEMPDISPRSPEEELAALRAVLTEAVAERDLTGYLTALRTAAVCMPLLEDPSPETGVRPAVVRGADNAIFLPIFTSADGLTEFAGNGVPFIAISFNDLIDDWPEPDWGVIIDPRTDRALTLTAVSLAELRSANPPDEAFATAAAG
ncbi:SseB family protein [Catenuloplanes sp. NPDC051500]|uniref:SseB family protein n=1 Tax=Catenuloplanes sp. NPDC051500 TaxID=3363959 RepID=UPI0037A294E3